MAVLLFLLLILSFQATVAASMFVVFFLCMIVICYEYCCLLYLYCYLLVCYSHDMYKQLSCSRYSRKEKQRNKEMLRNDSFSGFDMPV